MEDNKFIPLTIIGYFNENPIQCSISWHLLQILLEIALIKYVIFFSVNNELFVPIYELTNLRGQQKAFKYFVWKDT